MTTLRNVIALCLLLGSCIYLTGVAPVAAAAEGDTKESRAASAAKTAREAGQRAVQAANEAVAVAAEESSQRAYEDLRAAAQRAEADAKQAAQEASIALSAAAQANKMAAARAAQRATEAAARLRPILMTSFAFILGVLPLAISSGAGAIGRQILGTAVVGGTTGASVIGFFLIPVTYAVFAGGLRGARRKATEVIAPDAASAPQS